MQTQDINHEIKEAQKALAALYERKRAIQAAEEKKLRELKKASKYEKHLLWLQMMQMASTGMTVPEIANKLGVSKNDIAIKISKAWRREFPAHYNANYEKIHKLGLLTALRDSPPIFTSR